MQDLIDLNEWFRHAIIGLAQRVRIVWLRVVGELRVEGSGSTVSYFRLYSYDGRERGRAADQIQYYYDFFARPGW